MAARIADNLRAAKKAGPLVQTLTEEKSKRLGAALDLGADDCG